MDEEADLVVVAALAQRLGERHQMIVMHPDDIVGLQQLLEFVGEEFVDAEITAEIAAREFGEVKPVMQDRPQHAVGEAVVEFLVVVLAQIDGGVSDVVVLGDLGRDLGSLVRHPPLQPNHSPPRRRSVGRITTSSPPARALAIGHANSVRDYDEPRQYRSPQLRDSLIAVKINPDIE